jgi:hypothetical protein
MRKNKQTNKKITNVKFPVNCVFVSMWLFLQKKTLSSDRIAIDFSTFPSNLNDVFNEYLKTFFFPLVMIVFVS